MNFQRKPFPPLPNRKDERAFAKFHDTLVDRLSLITCGIIYKNDSYRMLAAKTSVDKLAQVVLSETLAKLHQKWAYYKAKPNIEAALITTLKNCLTNHVRQEFIQKRLTSIANILAETESVQFESPQIISERNESAAEQKRLLTEVDKFLDTIDPIDKLIFRLYRYEYKKYPEIYKLLISKKLIPLSLTYDNIRKKSYRTFNDLKVYMKDLKAK